MDKLAYVKILLSKKTKNPLLVVSRMNLKVILTHKNNKYSTPNIQKLQRYPSIIVRESKPVLYWFTSRGRGDYKKT